jgi:DNA-binding NtrC family response regulator
MARILLIVDPDGQDEGAIGAALERHRHSIQVAASYHDAAEYFRETDLVPDVVIVDLTADTPSEWKNLEEVSQLGFASHHFGLLAFSRVFRGATMKLRAERYHARFVWL